jgi:uncharacterized protein (TIGR00156 family)
MLVVLLGLSGAAVAKHGDGSYQTEPDRSEAVGITQALSSADDSKVTLFGQIEKRLKKDKYLFKDASGTGIVEIDHKIWNGQTVTPNDRVLLSGKVDRHDDENKSKIKVKKLIKM